MAGRLGLAGAGARWNWTVRRHLFTATCGEGWQPSSSVHLRAARLPASSAKNSRPMPVIQKKRLSTDMLPPGLSERQRFMFFAELFEHFSNTGELDPAEDVPFRAEMNSIHVGTTMLGRCDGTFTTVRRERRQVLATNDDRYCLARNTGSHESRVTHRGREFVMRPGSMALLKLDEPFFAA